MTIRSLAPASRTLLAFRGPDAERYLNGQVTQDVRDLADRALPACVTDAKGRLQAFVRVFRGPEDSLWVEAPPELKDDLEARLGRYLIADDAEILDLSSDWQLLHVPGGEELSDVVGGFARNCDRVTVGGVDLWVPVASPVPSGFEFLSESEAETLRIRSRLPKWGAELLPGMLPPEAGLDRTAICYRKGCYIGQEVLSRMKTAGKVNRRLTSFLVDPGIAVGDPLEFGGKAAGVLTSVAPWPEEGGLHAALGYLEKSAFEAEEPGIPGKGTARVIGFV